MNADKGRPGFGPGRQAGLALALSVMASYTEETAAWHYEHGLFLLAARAAGEAWGEGGLVSASDRIMRHFVGKDGSIAGYRREDFNLDQINPGRNLFELLKDDSDGRIRAAIEVLASQLRDQPRTRSGGFWHKRIYPDQMWLDGLYMAGPFRARYAAELGSGEGLEDLVSQFELAARKTRDPRTGLHYHAWDESALQLWANAETGCSPNFWGRAMGWFAMAIVDSLDWIPPGHPGRSRLSAIFAELASSLMRFQDEGTGLWHQVVDQGGREGNYLEASVSSMLAYSFAKASRLGIVSGAQIAGAARRAYRGCLARFLRTSGEGKVSLEGTCSVAGLGGDPYRDGSYEYYVGESVKTDDFKGVGPFILASIEHALAGEGE